MLCVCVWGGGHMGVANDHKGIAKNHLSCACLYPDKRPDFGRFVEVLGGFGFPQLL